jgi:O-antigen/teichoic acid export membrane protein
MQDVSGPTQGTLERWPLLSSVALRLHRLRAMLGRRPFLKNVSIMFTGSATGQMVSILLSPVLTRLYSPEQVGILSVYLAILTILVVVASLRYELALPLVATEEDAINLVAVCGCALIATTTMIAIAAFAIPEEALEAVWPTPINASHIAGFRALLVIGFSCLGGYFIALYLATWQGAYRAIARTRLYQGIVGPLTQIGLGAAGLGAPGLLIGSILGQSTGTVSLFHGLLQMRRTLLCAISVRRMVALARRYCRFPLIASWAALIDKAGGNQLLYLLVTVEYSAQIAGFIFLAERIIARPLLLVGTSILQVFIGEAGKTAGTEPERFRKRFYQIISRQFLLAGAWVMSTNLAATFLFPIVFGARWGNAVIYLEAMSVCYLAQAVVLPVFHTLQIMEKQAIAAAWQLGRLLLVVSTFSLCIHFDVDAPKAILIYSGAQALSCVVLLALMAASIRRLQR